MTQFLKQIVNKPSVWLAWFAALLYCSWPLGYLLNPALGQHALASQLEAPHQPYNWLFISMDVLTGLVILAVGFLQLTKSTTTTFLKFCVICYMGFGALVAIAALSPLNCDPATGTCGPISHNPTLLLHGVCSIFSVILLLFSVVMLAKLAYSHNAISKFTYLLFIGLLGCWVIFGLGSLITMWEHIQGNLLQDYFITVCSISVVLVVSAVEYLKSNKPYDFGQRNARRKWTIGYEETVR